MNLPFTRRQIETISCTRATLQTEQDPMTSRNHWPDDPVLHALLTSIRPPPGWKEVHTQKICALLVGAVAGLVKAKWLLEKPSAYDPESHPQWLPDTLYRDLIKGIGKPGELRWDNGINLRLWSLGYFLNRALHNIMATIDCGANQWLETKGLRYRRVENQIADVFFYPVGTRLQILLESNAAQEMSADAHESVARLASGINGWMDTERASSAVDCLANRSAERMEKTLGLIQNTAPFTEAECVGIVIGVVNRFKHLPELDRRRGYEHLAVWTIAARALGALGNFWSHMTRELLSRAMKTQEKAPL